jgi:TetR/AcrR family transcriptional repressor of nem operon
VNKAIFDRYVQNCNLWAMSRPKEFDRAEALTAAKSVFWKKGYDATTTDDLRHAMSIGRQSLYDSFGGKRPLYLEVLQRYNTERVIAQITELRAAKSPLAGIRNLLLALAKEPEEKRKLGCFGVAAICAFGDQDPEVAAITHASSAVLGSALEEVLRKAKRMGEVKPSLEERAVAYFLQSTMVGMKLTARAGASPEVLRAIAATALKVLTV